MPVSEARMLQAIYDALFAAFADPPPGAARQGGSPPQDTFLTLNWPGTQISETDFANPASAENTAGNPTATENFSTLVDRIPSVNPIYAPNGNLISDVYGLVLNANPVVPQADPVRRQAYEEAHALLTAKGTDFDETGKPVEVEVDSPMYANYKRKKRALDAAETAFLAQYFRLDMSKPEDQRQWSLMGPTYQSALALAQQDFEAAHARRIEDALATIAQSAENQVGVVFNAARAQFEGIRRSSTVDPARIYRPSSALPGNWFAPSAAEAWTDMTIESGSEKTAEHSDFTTGGVSAKATLGMWSVGPSFDASTSHDTSDAETSDLTVSFKFARVEIARPWLNFLLFGLGGWSTPTLPPGSLSNGTKDQAAGARFPLLPTSFIAVRNLKVSAHWGHKDQSLITSKLGGSLSLGYGPFALSGNIGHGSTDKTFSSEFDGTTISNSGLQIIGWINQVVPDSPPTLAKQG